MPASRCHFSKVCLNIHEDEEEAEQDQDVQEGEEEGIEDIEKIANKEVERVNAKKVGIAEVFDEDDDSDYAEDGFT